jgi:enoyl-CoA hydratase/carnithine racemase
MAFAPPRAWKISPMTDDLIVTRDAAGVVRITLNRPGRLNALGVGLVDALITEVGRASDANLLVIRGAGRAFSAGADLKERHGMSDDARWSHNRALNAAVNAIEALPIPTIAAINGLALGGGCELALGCDIRIATETAVIGLTEARIGAIPGAGGTQRLPRLIGVSRALDMMFTAEPISARRALEIGLVNQVHPADDFDAALDRMIAMIAARAPRATELLKRTVREGVATSLPEGLEIERLALNAVFGSADYAEGLAAFADKRAPRFQPRRGC